MGRQWTGRHSKGTFRTRCVLDTIVEFPLVQLEGGIERNGIRVIRLNEATMTRSLVVVGCAHSQTSYWCRDSCSGVKVQHIRWSECPRTGSFAVVHDSA